jgi:hypothetical protein
LARFAAKAGLGVLHGFAAADVAPENLGQEKPEGRVLGEEAVPSGGFGLELDPGSEKGLDFLEGAFAQGMELGGGFAGFHGNSPEKGLDTGHATKYIYLE